MKQRLYAFWKYDHFPYVLGGEVTKMLPDGAVETVGYGKGFSFTPFKIVPLEEGKKIVAQLQSLKDAKNKAEAEHRKEWNKRLEEIIKIP